MEGAAISLALLGGAMKASTTRTAVEEGSTTHKGRGNAAPPTRVEGEGTITHKEEDGAAPPKGKRSTTHGRKAALPSWKEGRRKHNQPKGGRGKEATPPKEAGGKQHHPKEGGKHL